MWLVIGYGNALHRDDSFGVVVAEQLKEHHSHALDVIVGTILKPEWMEPISQADGVIFVDISANLPPGQLQTIRLDGSHSQSPTPGSPFTHHTTPEMLVQGAHTLYGQSPPAWLHVVGGADFSLGESLSPLVEPMVPQVVALTLNMVAAGVFDGSPGT